MNASKGLLYKFTLESLDTSSEFFKLKFKECKIKFSEESVHDFRVSMRRFMALLDLLNKLFPSIYFTQIRKILKNQLKVFNPLRDTQVQILKLRSTIYTHPSLFTYYTSLLHDEQIHINNVKEFIVDLSIEDIEGLIFFIRLDIKNRLRNCELNFQSLTESAKNSFTNLLEKKALLDLNNLDTVHKLRIAFKKYRYIIENLFPYIQYPKDSLKKMKQIQNILGDIQDNRVFFAQLTIFVSETSQEMKQFYSQPLKDILQKRNNLLFELSEVLVNVEYLWNEDFFRLKKDKKSKTELPQLF